MTFCRMLPKFYAVKNNPNASTLFCRGGVLAHKLLFIQSMTQIHAKLKMLFKAQKFIKTKQIS